MSDKLYDDSSAWYKNAAGLYVQAEPISQALIASASEDDVVAVASDATLKLSTLSGANVGASGEGIYKEKVGAEFRFKNIKAGTDITVTATANDELEIASTASGGGDGGGLASPDDPPASPNTEDDEFDSSTLNAKWTQSLTGSPSVDINTTWASRYFVDFTGSQTAKITQSYAPSGDFSLTAKVHLAAGTSGQIADMWVDDATAVNSAFVQYAAASPGVLLLTQDGSGSFTGRATSSVPLREFSTIYLHLQRDSTTWSSWWSYDGWSFYRVGTHSKSLTVASLTVRLVSPASPPCRMGIDWVRRDWVTL